MIYYLNDRNANIDLCYIYQSLGVFVTSLLLLLIVLFYN